jgi:L,D-peptidoglycan transpeptidase YkuD (ErfK/YbiS/YcfS/YnhG family)
MTTMPHAGWDASLCRKCAVAVVILASVAVPSVLDAAPLDGARQLVVAVAPSWNSSSGLAQRFERSGTDWRATGSAWRVLFGRNGLAWGSGVRGQDEKGNRKVEKDGRAPAGIFRIGTIYTYDRALPAGSDYPFHTVTAADAWVDDVNHPDYNRHVVVDPRNPPAWFEKQKMRLGDFAYRWLVEIRHNAEPPVPGQGSAIFLHIRRGPQRPSAGCTTMAEDDLVALIRWLRSGARPHFVLLPSSEYAGRVRAWGLPSPDAARDVLE